MVVVVDHGHPLLTITVPIISLSLIVVFYTSVILISMHNASYEQWLIGVGVGAGFSLWRW
jgi:hypothetical protein